jgi:type IV pilus assembly protein PilB
MSSLELTAMNQKGLLGAILLGQHHITLDQLDECLKLQSVRNEKLGHILVEKGYVSEKDLIRALAIQEKFPIVPIDLALIDEDVPALVGLALAMKYTCIPLQRHKDSLTVAMSDPLDFQAINDIRFRCGLEVNPIYAVRDEIIAAIRFFYKVEESASLPSTVNRDRVEHLEYKKADYLDFGKAEHLGSDMKEHLGGDRDQGMTGESETSLTPVIRMQNMIIDEALKAGVSDIHIEPRAKFVQIRNRIDGWLMDTIQVPKWMQEALLSRLKILANMDISEKRLPQDASFSVKKENEVIDLRVSTLPTKYGEKMVLRILDKSRSLLSLEELGLYPKQKTLIKSLIEKPQGLILVVGPTGSGKTTTLYSMINTINSGDLNIVTIEDPIEYELEGINQVQINEKAGLTFASTLRSVLRQDPDVILVGEIRDQETATIAFRAAFTGHLVLSTLHTNDTVSTITRLNDIGIEPYIIASTLLAVISQRLLRRTCPHCRESYTPPAEVLSKFPNIKTKKSGLGFSRGKGCSVCNYKGYHGREGFYEIMTFNSKIREAITQKASEQTLRKLAMEQGMVPLINEGFRRANKGLVSLEEVIRVIATTQESLNSCPNCGESVDPDFLICPYCQTALSRKCVSCSRVLQGDWTICPYCGKLPLETHRPYEEISK